MGVWIETDNRSDHNQAIAVTPCMGVWIETKFARSLSLCHGVTPCMGVWIETVKVKNSLFISVSHPVWVCGLKHGEQITKERVTRHTLYGCVD